MPDLITIIGRWIKPILLITLIITGIAAIVLFLQKNKYLSTVTALAANSVAADRAKIFNESIQHLYSPFGSPDELDRIEGTALLSSLYYAVAREHSLVNNYKAKDSTEAANILKKNTKIYRSEHGTLKIKVWDENRDMAAKLANALFEEIQRKHQELQVQTDIIILRQLNANYDKLLNDYRAIDSTSNSGIENDLKKRALQEQLFELQKQKSQFGVMVAAKTPPLLLMEAATPSAKPDKPKRLQLLFMVIAGSFIFSLLLALLLESRNRND